MFFIPLKQLRNFVQLGFNLSKSNWHTWVQFNTDLFKETHELIYTKYEPDAMLIKWWLKVDESQKKELWIESAVAEEIFELSCNKIFCANVKSTCRSNTQNLTTKN